MTIRELQTEGDHHTFIYTGFNVKSRELSVLGLIGEKLIRT